MLKEPYAKVRIFDMKMQKISLLNIEASDKDGQKVFADIVINFKVKDKESARTIYTTIGDPQTYVQTLALQEKAQEGFKGVTVKYGALEILDKRDEVKEKARLNIFNRLPVDILDVESISIIDIRYTKSFDDAIQRKKDAEQLALASQKEVAIAEAEANKAVAKAEGEKKVKVLQAEAEAESLRIQKEQITKELIELRKIDAQKLAVEKWDGKLPQIITGGGSIPFINIGQPITESTAGGG
jgi:regulator of protease activity HflC (stomatin/prohibitin superfamily)